MVDSVGVVSSVIKCIRKTENMPCTVLDKTRCLYLKSLLSSEASCNLET